MTAHHFLGRVLIHEVDTASLLAFVARRDPEPLCRILRLREPIREVRVEVPFGKRNRLDLVVYGEGGHPTAVLEVKVAATEHGDQLTRYQEFADQHGAAMFLIDLELPGSKVPPGWTRFSLAEVFECWADSLDDTARVFSTAIAEVFRGWQEQGVGSLAGISAAMYPVVMRSIATGLASDGRRAFASATSAGQPALVAYAPHPSGIEGAHLCVNLRCQDKSQSDKSWVYRIGVHVDKGHDRADARRTAHRLAAELEPALNLADLTTALEAITNKPLGSTLSGANPMKQPRNREDRLRNWLTEVDAAGNGRVGRHPVFHHDDGRRLTAQFYLGPELVTGADLRELLDSTLRYLARACQGEQPDAGATQDVRPSHN